MSEERNTIINHYVIGIGVSWADNGIEAFGHEHSMLPIAALHHVCDCSEISMGEDATYL